MKSAPNYVIGIDGGATHSQALALAVPDGRILAQARGNALNAHAEDTAMFRRNLSSLLNDLASALRGVCQNAVIGTATLLDEAPAAWRHELLHDLDPLPESTLLCGDAVTALHGATSGEPGLLVISGTGSIAIANDANGKRRTMGGLGALLGGDPGSAFWMSCQAILKAQQSRDPNDPLRLAVSSFFDVDHFESLIGRPIRSIAALCGHLATGDYQETIWTKIEQAAGRELAQMAWPLLRADLSLPVYYSGSVLCRNARVLKSFSSFLTTLAGREVRPQRPRGTAVEGAAHLALKRYVQSC